MMPDAALTVGLALAILGFPAVVSAFAERRRPWTGLVLLLAAGCFAGYALGTGEGGYTLLDVPLAVAATLARITG